MNKFDMHIPSSTFCVVLIACVFLAPTWYQMLMAMITLVWIVLINVNETETKLSEQKLKGTLNEKEKK